MFSFFIWSCDVVEVFSDAEAVCVWARVHVDENVPTSFSADCLTSGEVLTSPQSPPISPYFQSVLSVDLFLVTTLLQKRSLTSSWCPVVSSTDLVRLPPPHRLTEAAGCSSANTFTPPTPLHPSHRPLSQRLSVISCRWRESSRRGRRHQWR